MSLLSFPGFAVFSKFPDFGLWIYVHMFHLYCFPFALSICKKEIVFSVLSIENACEICQVLFVFFYPYILPNSDRRLFILRIIYIVCFISYLPRNSKEQKT